MLEKDESIVELLARLSMDERGWVIEDHWNADLMAVGIAHPSDRRRLVYVSTFGKENGRYDYACEVPTGPEPADFATSDSGEDVEYRALLAAIERHLTPR
ncbi:hypothetical protein [Archangium sp. Cb G35]|uniref:hypothetical protein n=1 Tax=Archangium sp. Cb G35 TaxID=1920190 RepID=UPI000A50AA14|nr:hypothetical protein [Archangium sp. Cb G35]